MHSAVPAIPLAKYAETLENFFSGAKIFVEVGNIFITGNFICVEIFLQPNVKIQKINGLTKEIGLVLGFPPPTIKIITQGKCLQLKFPLKPRKISVLDYYQSFSKPSEFNLPFLLGESEDGNPFWVDMSKNPHLLIAGATNSGKSVCLHNLIFNALQTKNLQLFLADPKQVELQDYKDFSSVVSVTNDFQSTKNMLTYLADQMEKRFSFFATYGVNDIWQIKENFRLPIIMVILDEIGDLFLQDEGKELEKILLRLLQKGRAAGIYVVAATQRPSVDVVSGILKANFPARLSFRVSSKIDSQVILDEPGAENLQGMGDALFKSSNVSLTRLQVAFANVEMNSQSNL
jgi:S-DNA-T family DNA segregation ATPase FtsK/SpoIIIE